MNEKSERQLDPEMEEDGEAYFEELEKKDPAFKDAWERRRRDPRRVLGELVLERRIELGLSQAKLAKKVGTSQNRIHLIENGETSPKLETLERLCYALDIRLMIRPNHETKTGELVSA